jgi:cytoskeletal protein RodZ
MEAYSLGSVNVDSLKEALLFLSTVYPFVDETAKETFTKQVNALDSAGNPTEGIVDQIHPTETPAETPAEIPAEAETPAEETTETAEETTPADVGTGTAVSNTATANESNDAPVEQTPDAKIAALEAQLADAKAAASQTPPETS